MDNGKYCYPDSDVLINNYDIHDKTLPSIVVDFLV